jgi:DNA-binding CsgD family transcriptional regulator
MVQASVSPGRDHLARTIVDEVADPAGAVATVIVGPTGVGLSMVLRQVGGALGGDRVRIVAAQQRRAPADSASDARPPRVNDLLRRGDTVLAIDDAQWLDADNLARLAELIRTAAGTGFRCVCTVRGELPNSTAAELVRDLVADGLVKVVCLRPLPDAELAALIADRLGAAPTPELAQHIHRLTRNQPGVVEIALDALTAAGDARVVDREAHLVRPDVLPVLPTNHELWQELRGLGPTVWSVAKALAVLAPTGDAALDLVAEATGQRRADVDEAVTALRGRGILRHQRNREQWRFRLPLLEKALIGQAGPFERRRLAQIAVTAIWTGRARGVDPDYLAEQQIRAGRMVDVPRARGELLAHAKRSMLAGARTADRWLRAAAELSCDPRERAAILCELWSFCAATEKATECLATLTSMLDDLSDHLPAAKLVDVHVAQVIMLRNNGNLDEVAALARGEHWRWPVDAVAQTITRVAALYVLGQWHQARALIRGAAVLSHDDTAERQATVFDALAGLWQGEPAGFRRCLADLEPDPTDECQQARQIQPYVGALLTLGDLPAAERVLAVGACHPAQLGTAEQAVLAARRGEFDRALDLTHRCMVTGPMLSPNPTYVSMIQTATLALLARGRIARARELLATAGEGRPVLSHLLAVPSAWLATMLGDNHRARDIVDDAILGAEAAGVVVGVDELWLAAAELAVTDRDRDRLDVCVRKAEAVAAALGTDRALMHSQVIRAAVDPRRGIVEQALQLARRLRQPFDLALAIEFLVRVDAVGPQLLLEAYELLGRADAVLVRARVRTLMRERNVAVSGRQATTEENERLLAVLVAEGLGNQQLATILSTSRKSVESRLSRLFSRAGYRSRVELAMAMLSERQSSSGQTGALRLSSAS